MMTFKRASAVASALLLGASMAPVSLAQTQQQPKAGAVIAYPKKGQSPEKVSKDKAECSTWASQQTGVSPDQIAQEAQQPGQSQGNPPQGGAVRGAGKGAAVGALGGAIGGDAGKGAAVGAGVGGATGLARRSRNAKQEEQKSEATQSQMNQSLASYHKAEAACLEGRGYSVE